LRPDFRSKFILRFDFLDITVRHEIGKRYITTRIVYNKGLDQGCTLFKSIFYPRFCLKHFCVKSYIQSLSLWV